MWENDAWKGFETGSWNESINVRDFIQKNYAPYEGDEGFLEKETERTRKMMKTLGVLLSEEQKKNGVLNVDCSMVSSLLNYEAGYLDKENELIVGLQTSAPLKRGVNPFGGIKMAREACEAYGYKLDDAIEREFSYKTTHNEGVFRVYTDEMKAARRSGIISGLPDAYGRGRIIGDYRRVALYGVNRLIEEKKKDKLLLSKNHMNAETIKQLEELFKQIDFLEKLKGMAALYGYNLSEPAHNFKEAVQWVYFAYLGAIKEQNGAAMSLGRVSTFLDIYAERDLRNGILTEVTIQEIMDDFVIKLRCARHLRTPDYNALFAGDPMWITEAIGGIGEEGRTLVTKTAYRMLHTLYTLGPAPEPNLTVLWSHALPKPFKAFCAKVSIDTNAIQYENDDVMRPSFGDDYAIACCVSAMKIGKQMQYFGARCNLPKVLLMALNGGRDELTGNQVGPVMEPLQGEVLNYNEVMERFDIYRAWLCQLYVNTMNVIHYMHDQYAYEKLQMALHDTQVERLMAFGIAGLSVAADSLSAIKHTHVKPVRGQSGLIERFDSDGSYPQFGNDDDRVDAIAVELVESFINELKKTPAYRSAIHTLSILTITSNVVYGKKTGATPDGRQRGEPFAPGANPMHHRDQKGALASLNSVAKIPYEACQDGVSCTFSVSPMTLGKEHQTQQKNLESILEGYFAQGAHHLNVNVLNRSQLQEAMDSPDKYPNLTIRVSGYAVHFNKLSRYQQLEVIERTFHENL